VKYAFPRLETEAMPLGGDVKQVSIWGLRFAEETRANFFNYREKSDGLVRGRFPRVGEDECLAGKGLAEKLNLKIGDRIPMTFAGGQNQELRIDPEIVGIIDFDFFWYDDNYLVLDFGYLQEAAGLGDKTQTISVFVDDPWIRDTARQGVLKGEIRKLFGDDNVAVESWQEADSVVLADVRVFKAVITILYAIFNVMAGFLILNTISMVIIERSKEIGLLASLGLGRLSILLSFLLEGAYLGLLGTAIGMALGGAEITALSGIPIDIALFFGEGDLPYSATFYFLNDFRIVALYGIQSFAVTVLCSALPAMRALRLNPVDAMRT
jgi:putative ABC transport system permease protein